MYEFYVDLTFTKLGLSDVKIIELALLESGEHGSRLEFYTLILLEVLIYMIKYTKPAELFPVDWFLARFTERDDLYDGTLFGPQHMFPMISMLYY